MSPFFSLLTLLALLFASIDAILAQRVHSSLPEEDRNLLHAVHQGVKSLRTPTRHRVAETPASPTCNFLGGLVSASLSTTCCQNVQVVSHRRLADYGLAQKCPQGWHCDAEGRMPTAVFESESLRRLCGEPRCLPAIVTAMQNYWATKDYANEIGGVCSSTAHLQNGESGVTAMSALLRSRASRRRRTDPAQDLECREEVCDVPSKRDPLCNSQNKTEKCYEKCCEDDSCFPGESTVIVKDAGTMPMKNVKLGDEVLVEARGRLAYEPVLTFLHIIRHARSTYVEVTHDLGKFRASGSHLVFIADTDGKRRQSKQVGLLATGDRIFAAVSGMRTPSRVQSIRYLSGVSGMYAPLTASGTIVVDGVLASTYAAPSQRAHLTHNLAHASTFPLRVYHWLGFSMWLRSFWARLCNGTANTKERWYCHGGNPAAEGPLEEMHPYIGIMYKSLRLDRFLPVGV